MFPEVAPEGNFQQGQADMLAHMIGDLENMISAGSALEDPEKKVELHMKAFFSFSCSLFYCVCFVLDNVS